MKLWSAISLACVYFSGRGYAENIESDKIAVNSDSFNESVQDTLFSKYSAGEYYDDDLSERVSDFKELQPYLILMKYANGTVPENLQLDDEIIFTFTMPATASFEVSVSLSAQVNYVSPSSCNGGTSSWKTYGACANDPNYAGNTYAITGAGMYTFLDQRADQEPSEIHCARMRDQIAGGAFFLSEINCAGSECVKAEGETVKDVGVLTLSGTSC